MLIRDSALHRSGANYFQRGKFLRRKPHLATGKACFWFQFCHAIEYVEGLVTINKFRRKKVPAEWVCVSVPNCLLQITARDSLRATCNFLLAVRSEIAKSTFSDRRSLCSPLSQQVSFCPAEARPNAATGTYSCTVNLTDL